MERTDDEVIERAGPSRLRLERVAVYVAVALSAGFIVLDARCGGFDSHRPDLRIELAARVLMLVLAVLAAQRTRGDSQLRLLLWAVICLSLDTYWQSTYRHVHETPFARIGANRLEWIEMIVKYVAVGLGLGLLLRLCARFGDAAPDRLRRLLHDWSFGIGAALSAIGLSHGVLYIQNCYFFVPRTDQCIIGDAAQISLDAYLIADAVVRLAIVAVAVVGTAHASAYKQRTLLVAYFSVWFALGTVIDFLARLPLPYYTVLLLQIGDATTTLLFPVGLLYAATRKQLFDVEYVVRISFRYVVTSLVIGVAIAAVEIYLHKGTLAKVASFLGLANDHPVVEYGAGIFFLLLWKPVEKVVERRLEEPVFRVVQPERERRREKLRTFIQKIPYIDNLVELEQLLQKALTQAVSATFADIFVHDGKAGFGAYLSTRNPRPPYLHETEPPVPSVSGGKHVCLKCKHENIPDAELAVPMPVGGKPYGILVCGPPDRQEVAHFAHDEIEQIKEFAATAGGALFALGANVKRPPREKTADPDRAPRKKSAKAASASRKETS